MTQQIINVGTAANDGTGEGLREAFTAVNDNFTEIYTAGPVGSNVVIANNTISINGTHGNLILQGNGIGNVVTNSSVRPSTDAVFDLGATNFRYDTVHAAYFQGNGAGLTGITVSAGSQILNANSNVRIADINGPVTVGGMVIYPGDLLHGDLNGIMTIPIEIASEVPEVCLEIARAEAIVLDYLKQENVTLSEFNAARKACGDAINTLGKKLRGE